MKPLESPLQKTQEGAVKRLVRGVRDSLLFMPASLLLSGCLFIGVSDGQASDKPKTAQCTEINRVNASVRCRDSIAGISCAGETRDGEKQIEYHCFDCGDCDRKLSWELEKRRIFDPND